MKLYYTPGTCSLSPHIVLRETKTPFTLMKTDLKTKKTEDGRDFLEVNPAGYVAALELDDGDVLTEGVAIVQYIADTARATHLAPANGTLARYRLQSWLNFVSHELHAVFGSLFTPKMPEEGKAIAIAKLRERFSLLDKRFAKNDYLMGDTYTVADAYCFTILTWAKGFGIDLADYPRLNAYFARIGERPAVVDAMQAEGLTH